MKIVMVSLTFLPKVGGLENIMSGLAEAWAKTNNEVTVFTNVAAGSVDNYPYQVQRQQSNFTLLQAVRNADVFVEANISLQTFWVGLLNRKKWFVIHHLHYAHDKGWKGKLKNYLTRFANNISVSQYIANTILGKGIVINNFFQPTFQRIASINKTKDIVFLGRLVSDKGVAVLLDALHLLRHLAISVTIIGEGPEKDKLQQQAAQLQLPNIEFVGIKKGEPLIATLNEHRLLVVPSTWPEPYGIVALEGMACGCMVVASNTGGLPEAVDKFGILYNDNSPELLAIAITKALNGLADYQQHQVDLQAYLSTKTVGIVAKEYLDYFSKVF